MTENKGWFDFPKTERLDIADIADIIIDEISDAMAGGVSTEEVKKRVRERIRQHEDNCNSRIPSVRKTF